AMAIKTMASSGMAASQPSPTRSEGSHRQTAPATPATAAISRSSAPSSPSTRGAAARVEPATMTSSTPPSRQAALTLIGGGRDILRLSGGRPAPLSPDREQIDPGEFREDGVSLRCAVRRVAGGQHELIEADRPDDADVAGVHHFVFVHRVRQG